MSAQQPTFTAQPTTTGQQTNGKPATQAQSTESKTPAETKQAENAKLLADPYHPARFKFAFSLYLSKTINGTIIANNSKGLSFLDHAINQSNPFVVEIIKPFMDLLNRENKGLHETCRAFRKQIEDTITFATELSADFDKNTEFDVQFNSLCEAYEKWYNTRKKTADAKAQTEARGNGQGVTQTQSQSQAQTQTTQITSTAQQNGTQAQQVQQQQQQQPMQQQQVQQQTGSQSQAQRKQISPGTILNVLASPSRDKNQMLMDLLMQQIKEDYEALKKTGSTTSSLPQYVAQVTHLDMTTVCCLLQTPEQAQQALAAVRGLTFQAPQSRQQQGQPQQQQQQVQQQQQQQQVQQQQQPETKENEPDAAPLKTPAKKPGGNSQ